MSQGIGPRPFCLNHKEDTSLRENQRVPGFHNVGICSGRRAGSRAHFSPRISSPPLCIVAEKNIVPKTRTCRSLSSPLGSDTCCVVRLTSLPESARFESGQTDTLWAAKNDTILFRVALCSENLEKMRCDRRSFQLTSLDYAATPSFCDESGCEFTSTLTFPTPTSC